MRRRWIGSLAAAALLAVMVVAWAPGTARADQRDFSLINGSSITITHVYVTHTSRDDWDDDILGIDVLLPGESTDVLFSRFDGEAGLCMYDIKVVGKDGEEGYLYEVDLCSISTVTFR